MRTKKKLKLHIETNSEATEESRKRTYHESGYRDSSRNSGNHTALSICLDAIYSKFQNEEKELVEKQNKLKELISMNRKIKKQKSKDFPSLWIIKKII
jgi:hypothetical protein